MTRIFLLLVLLCYQKKSESRDITKFCRSSFLYLKHYLSDYCNSYSTNTIFASESGKHSSGIFKMTRNNTPYDIDKNCKMLLYIPDNYKVLLSFFYVDMRKNEYGQCVDQLQIIHLSNSKLILKPICGKWYNKHGDRTVFPLGSFMMRFLSNATGYNWNYTGFSFMYTVFNYSKNGVCYGKDRFKCKNYNMCIWKELVCDGYNNCVDGSDERNCYEKSNNPVGIGGYIGLTFAVLLLILILLFLVSPPLKRDLSRVPEIPTISSSCQWHTGTSNFPPPYSEIVDRPPTYEEAVRTNTS